MAEFRNAFSIRDADLDWKLRGVMSVQSDWLKNLFRSEGETEPFVWREKDGAALALLNRPRYCNALSLSLLESFAERLRGLHRRPDLRVLFIAGVGKHFCAGLDLREASSEGELVLPAEKVRSFIGSAFPTSIFEVRRNTAEKGNADVCVPKSLWMPRLVAEILWHLTVIPQIAVGIAQGCAYGGGGGILSACDIALAMPDLRAAFPETRWGLSPDLLHPFLKRRMSAAAMAPLLLTGAPAAAEEALRLGLVDAVLPESPESALSRTAEIAETIFDGEPNAVREAKNFFGKGRNPESDEIVHGILEHWKSWKREVVQRKIRSFFSCERGSSFVGGKEGSSRNRM